MSNTAEFSTFAFSYRNIMRRNIITLSLFLAFVAGLASCSTDVDLYADYKDIPVVYGLIDMTKDTNYVKIIRAFSGSHGTSINANEIALISDSSNYPGKLDVKIIEYRHQGYGNDFYPTGTEFVLDTITLHNKLPGAFYSPDQKVYYTTGAFKTDDVQGTRYKYRLEIKKGNDTISSETGIVGGDRFYTTLASVNFDTIQPLPGKIYFNEANNASLYEFKMEFNYRERLPNQAFEDKKIEWSLGTYNINDLSQDNGVYYVTYKRETLWTLLKTAIGSDTINANRIIGDFNIYIAAGGTELDNYIEVNAPSNSISQNIPEYTNITGGYGVFSSRINKSKTVVLSPNTQRLLIENTGWGFHFQ